MNKKTTLILALTVLVAVFLAACGGPESADQANPENDVINAQPEENEDASPPADEQSEEAPTVEASPPLASDPDFEPQPSDPQAVEIPTPDGRLLEGYFFPASVPNAPLVVLMHWAGGNYLDWTAIAPWLQNRGVVLDWPPADVDGPWLDASWFPMMPPEVSFAVLVFNYGDFGNSPYGDTRESWVDDSLAAMVFGSSLEGVDPHRIITLGASIGADGAVDGCYLFNDAGEYGTCIGALSLSPGNYLTDTYTYPEAAEYIDLAGFPVWCWAAEGDGNSPALCRALTGQMARTFLFSGGDHGMRLLTPDQALLEPIPGFDGNAMLLLQEFFEQFGDAALNEFSLP